MKYSETKLNDLVKVQIEPDIVLFIKNKILTHRIANSKEGWYIYDNHRNQKLNEVILYKRIFDDNGDLLDEPIYDIDDYYICNDAMKIKNKFDGLGVEYD